VRALLKKNGVFMANLIGSPGAGKTSILEKTIDRLKTRYQIAVIEGDVATDRDAQRIRKHGVPVVLINTDGACHLESETIERALGEFDLNTLDIVFVENVGNLVCPAEFDIGETAKVAVSSVAEGDDKPEKYPLLFREAKAVLLNKTDFISLTDFNKSAFIKDVKKINGTIPVFEMSCRKDEGFEEWVEWVEKQIQ
jgi:hydrogenase nickel incorporation protein HypB